MWKRICEWLPVVLLGVGCDATIHEYPTEQQSQVIVEVNVDRLPPLYYKELQYDAEGNHTERLMNRFIQHLIQLVKILKCAL